MKQAIIYSIFFILVISSCNSRPPKEIVVEQPNPTAYIFHFKFESVKETILKSLNYYKFQSTIGKENFDSDKGELVSYECLLAEPYSKSTAQMWPEGEKFFYRPNYNTDIFIYTYGYAPSMVYFSTNGKDPLIFTANYYLHLDKLDENTTKVTVITINNRVMTGRELLPTPQMCGFGRSAIFKTVPPTTVEQYEMLLQIGTTLGEKNMPKKIIPTKICLTRTGKVK
jgi:hypothetical protein